MGFDVVVKNDNTIVYDLEKLNNEVDDILASVQGVIYQNDQKQEAKKVRATLNKLSKEINDKKIAVKKEYMKPYKEFEESIKAVICKINDVSEFVDKQVKEIECEESKGKLIKIKGIWSKYEQELNLKLDFDSYYNEKWMQISYSFAKIEKEIGNIFLDAKLNDKNGKTDYVIKVYATKDQVQTICGLMKQMALDYDCEEDLPF